MALFKELRKELTQYLKPAQVKKIEQAYEFGAKAHSGQTRRSGEPYITHPLSVALILAEIRMDPDTIMAAILHDVIEDTGTEKSVISDLFGEQVADLVDGVSKLTQIKFESRAEAQAENFRKMVLAMSRDIRVILVKLADRLHNMRTLGALPREKKQRIANETLEIYAPIAKRLGMHNFCLEFEELCFESLHPMRYRALKLAMKQKHGRHKKFIKTIESGIKKKLKEWKLQQAEVFGRQKHLNSIYRKMRDKQIAFSDIMDVFGFRIIVDDVESCYRTLGVVHSLYKPVPERFKDYIAIPKSNGYQSLHTTLFGPTGIPIEIQIRTPEMNLLAENGIAAHWSYKSNEKVGNDAQLRAQMWLKNLLEIQQSTGNSLEFIENVKIDLFPDEVYIFTPRGDIMELPGGACAVDFAYAVHSDIGNTCVAVRIDRQLAPLSTVLTSGQTVEVITAAGARPNPAWLNFVVSGKARSNIRHYLKSRRQAESIALGKHLLNRVLATFRLSLDTLPQANIDRVLEESNLPDLDTLCEETGLGNQMPLLVAQRLADNTATDNDEAAQEHTDCQALMIKGSEGMVVSFADCCQPIPGDAVVGCLNRGRGFTVHTTDCRKIMSLRNDATKCIDARWEDDIQGEFNVDARIDVFNRRGMLATLAMAMADAEANITNINVEERDGHYCSVVFTLGVRDRVHLARVMRRMRSVKDVVRITRDKQRPTDS